MASQRQIEANRKNRAKRQGVTPEGREQLREAALRNRPWEHSTGPRTEAGKRRSRENALFSGQHCRTVEPFASIDRLKRLLARQAYHHARLALLTQRLLARHPDVVDAIEFGSLPAVDAAGLPGDRDTAVSDEAARMLEELASLVEVVEEEEPLRQQAWRRVAALFEMPMTDMVAPTEQPGPEASNTDHSRDKQAPDTPLPGNHSAHEFPTDLALCDRLIRHIVSRPVTLGSTAVAGLFEQIVNTLVWPGIAGLGLWERTYQRMARRDELLLAGPQCRLGLGRNRCEQGHACFAGAHARPEDGDVWGEDRPACRKDAALRTRVPSRSIAGTPLLLLSPKPAASRVSACPVSCDFSGSTAQASQCTAGVACPWDQAVGIRRLLRCGPYPKAISVKLTRL